MKLLKTVCTTGLMYLMSLVSALIFIALLIQVISLSFWTILLICAAGSVIYFFLRGAE